MWRLNRCVFVVMGLTAITIGAAGHEPVSSVDPETVLNALQPGHPRLMLTDQRLAELKAGAANDPVLSNYVATVVNQADATLQKPPLEHKLVGPRLLSVSRECLARIYTLGVAWRWTGDERYAKAAQQNLLTVCAFPDWNPSHFLDTAEMSHAVGVGYDWFYSYLSEATRETIRNGLIELGMKPGQRAYDNDAWWTRSEFNWNQVCNGGLSVGALAIAETDPQYAEFIIPRAVASLPKALAAYGPDGAWMEGPGYWHYATRYTAFGLCAMDTALGTDFGLSDIEGLSVTGLFPTYTTGPTGLLLNYADSGERSARRPMSCMFWLARKYDNTFMSDAEHAVASAFGPDAGHVVWYVPPSGQPTGHRDLDRHFRSPVDIIVMRSAWDDPNGLFVGVKGGYNQVNHGHLDLGNFEVDALGVRWVRDLGSDNYNLPGYWDKKVGGKRWQYYRLNSHSHNVPVLSNTDQDADAVANVIHFDSQPNGASVMLDLTSAYKDFAGAVTRGVALTADRRAVLVQDEFVLTESCEVQWGMTTDADIVVHDDGTATLRQDGKELLARVLSPKGAQFSVESAEQQPPQKTNEGVHRLLVKTSSSSRLTVAVELAPVWDEAGPVEPATMKPLSEW